MSANDFFASLTKQAREKDRTVSKSSTVNSKAATISAPATDADTFFSSLNRQAQFIDRNGFTPKTLANVGNVSKEASAAKAPLLSGYEERSFGDTVRDIGTVVGGAILQGADAAATGISSTLDFLIGRPLQALGWENNPASWLNDKLQSEREANAEYFNQQLEGNEAAQTALDLGTAVTRAAWELPLIIMTGGASKAAQAGTKGLQATAALETTLRSSGIGQTVTNAVNLLQRQLRNPQTWQSFASTTGQAYEDAKAQGASEASATAYAVINGLLGSLVEVGGGGIQELPDVLRQPSRLRNWIDTMLDEGKEEVVQGVIDRLTENVTGVANNPIVGSQDENAVLNLGTALEEFGGGALVGGILGGGQIGVDAALNRIRGNASQNAAEAPVAGAVPQTGVDTSTGVNPVEAGIDASVRLFNEGGGVIDAQAPNNTASEDGSLISANENQQETTSDGRASQTGTVDTVSSPAGNSSISPAGANVNALADSMTDEQLALEQQRIREQYAALNQPAAQTSQNGEVSATDSTGAAPRGFDTYSAALERYGEMPERGTGAREVSIPRAMNDDSVVPQTVQTFANAEATPETTYTDITRILEQGGFNRAVITDRASLGRAEQTITDKGFQQALIDWTATVRSGRVSKDTTTLGLALYNNAINSGDTQTGIQILTDIVDNARTAAQATQAMSILNKLTPEGRLYGVQRSIANLQEKIRERNTGGISDEQINRAQANIEQQRDDALNLIAQMHEIFSGGSKRQNSPDWITQIANELARNISARANTNTPRERTFAETVLSDLVKFAEEHALPRRQNIRRQRTAAERISDYFANRNEYARAWAQAQEIVRKRHGDAYTGNLTFDDWLSASIGYTGDGTDGVMLRAVADAALRGDPAVRNRVKQHLAVRSEYGDADAVVDEIYNRLLEDVTVTEYSDRIVLRNAVQRYIAELVQDTDTNRPVNSALRSAMHDAGVRMREIIRQGASTKEQVANNLARMLVNEFGFSENGAADFSSNVVNRFNEQVAEASKRALSSMFRPRQARQRRTFEQRLTEMANLGAFSSDEFSVQASQRLFGDLGDDIRLNDELVQNYLSAADEDARFAALNEIYKDIANQIPQNWYDKLNAWRYFAMLANPRTHVRNVLGNSAMAGLTSIRNRISSGLQRRFVSDRSQRTRETTSRRSSAEDAARYQVGMQEYKRINDMLGDAGKYTNELNRIRRHMRAPFNGVLGKAVDFASNTLEAEDIFFSQKAYASNLAQFLRARGITAEDYVSGNAGQEVIAEAQAYAIREAQRLTFRDFNTFSNFVQRIANLGGDSAAGRVWQTIVGANIPFTRTPANIVVRGVEYSPIGLARGLYNLGVNVKRGNMTAGEAIDQISSGLVGTALVGLGALLASQGVITGGGSDDEEQAAFDELRGFQPYALQIGGNSYTLDWLAPAALPFFTGAEIWNQLAGSGSEDEETNALEAVLQGIGHMTDPMLEMSMLSGISDLLDSVAYYQGSNSIWPVLSSSVTNYISQFFPSVFGAIERTIEDTRQSSYTDPTSIIPDDLQYPISQAMNRLPGEYNQVDYIDAWGRTESTGSLAGRAASNFVSPGYYSRLSESEVEDELQRVYDATGGEYNVFPDRATMGNTTINGERLTPEQYTEYATTLGQTRLAEVSALMETDAYKAMSDAEKARAIQEVYDYALQTAKHVIDPSYEVDSRYEKAAEYGDIAEYLAFDRAWSSVEDSKGANTAAFEAVMQDYERMSTQKQNALMEALGEGTRFDDVVDAYEAGIDPERWYDAYDEWRAIDGGEGSATDKATQFAQWLETEGGYSENESNLLQDQLAYYSMIRGNAERYDELRDFGFSPQESYNLYEAIGEMNTFKADKDENGESISGSKKAKVIAFIDALNLTPAEKDILFNEFTTYTGLEDTPWH